MSVYAFVCVVFLGFSCITNSVNAAGATSGSCGDNADWSFQDGVLTINGTGTMTSAPWSHLKSSITSVVIKEGIQSVKDSAFSNYGSLVSVTIPNGLTSIGEYAFSTCAKLAEVSFGEDSVLTIKDAAFSNCDSLVEITLPNSLKAIPRDCFSNCDKLETVILPDGLTSISNCAFQFCSKLWNVSSFPDSLTSVGDCAFYGCDLRNVNIPKNLTSLGGSVFSGCSNILSFDVADGNTRFSSSNGVLFDHDKTSLIQFPGGKSGTYTIPNTVATIKAGAFSKCKGIKSVTMSDDVMTIEDSAFSECSMLENITVSKNIKKFQSNIFYECVNLRRVNIPDGLEVIQNYAFYHCASLEHLTIPVGVKNLGTSPFGKCGNLLSIDVEAGNAKYESLDGVVYTREKKALVQCPAGKSGKFIIPDEVTSLSRFAFEGCQKLTSIIIPDGVGYIGDDCFVNCDGLTSITIPSSVTSTGSNIFNFCNNLKSVFYQGSHINGYNFFFPEPENVCVAPDYDSPVFGGAQVTSEKPICAEFRELFDHCFEGAYIDDDLIQRKRKNATDWEKNSNDCANYFCVNSSGRDVTRINEKKWVELSQQVNACVEVVCKNKDWVIDDRKNTTEWISQTDDCATYQCDATEGPVLTRLCKRTDSVFWTCLNGKCIDYNKIRGARVVIGYRQNTYTYLNLTDFAATVALLSSKTTDAKRVGVETDENGMITQTIILTDDEDDSNAIASSLDNIDRGSSCQYGILCFMNSVRVVVPDASISDSSSVSESSVVSKASNSSEAKVVSVSSAQISVVHNWILLLFVVLDLFL